VLQFDYRQLASPVLKMTIKNGYWIKLLSIRPFDDTAVEPVSIELRFGQRSISASNDRYRMPNEFPTSQPAQSSTAFGMKLT
jgi:hypothetical protein